MRPGLFWHVAGIEARKRMSYRADFWISAVVGLGVQMVLSYFIVFALFRESGQPRVGGFSVQGMLLYLVVAALFGKLVRSTEMEQSFSQDIYEGGLTRYLLYPSSYAVFKYAQQVGALFPFLLQVLLMVWVPFWVGFPEEFRITPPSVAMGLAALVAANLLYFLLTWPIQSVAFWAENVWSLTVAHRIVAAILGGMTIPLTLFPEWAQRILAFLPFRFLFAFPVDALLGRLSIGEWSQGMALALTWCVLAGGLGHLVWRRGGLQYTGVGI